MPSTPAGDGYQGFGFQAGEGGPFNKQGSRKTVTFKGDVQTIQCSPPGNEGEEDDEGGFKWGCTAAPDCQLPPPPPPTTCDNPLSPQESICESRV